MLNLNLEVCNKLLISYIVWKIFGVALFLLFVNLAFWIIKLLKKMKLSGAWISINVLGIALLLSFVVPPVLDIVNSSYCEIGSVVSIEVASDEQRYHDVFRDNMLLVVDANGETYCTYDFLMQDRTALLGADFPGTFVFTKYSRLALAYFSDSGQVIY